MAGLQFGVVSSVMNNNGLDFLTFLNSSNYQTFVSAIIGMFCLEESLG